ncbi:MAG: hypothetical protein ACLFQB_15635 [Chitinispirillaceae bacterium]
MSTKNVGIYALLLVTVCAFGAFSEHPISVLPVQQDTVDDGDDENGQFPPPDTTPPGPAPGMQETKRRAAEFTFGGFGPAVMENITSEDLAYSFQFGKIWEVNPYAGIRAMAEVSSDFSNSAVAGVNLGLNFVPFESEISPFLSGDFGFGYARDDTENLFGFNAGVSAGLQLFRYSTVQMLIEGRAHTLLDEWNGDYPTVYSARIGLLY